MFYRFSDSYKSISLDYILFFNKEHLEIDLRANKQWDITKKFKIINEKIDWADVDVSVVTLKCQEFCNKILKLKVFL